MTQSNEEEERILDILENTSSLVASSSARMGGGGAVPSGSIDDMIGADIERMRDSAGSFTGPSGLTSNYGSKSPADVRSAVPAVPRFRFVQGGIKKKGTQGLSANYESSDDEDEEFDSGDDSDAGPHQMRYSGAKGFGESLRLATFRGGESDDDGNESDDTDKMYKRGPPKKRYSQTEGELDEIEVDAKNTLSADISPRVQNKILRGGKVKKSRGGGSRYSSAGGGGFRSGTTAGIITDLDGVVDRLDKNFGDGFGFSGIGGGGTSGNYTDLNGGYDMNYEGEPPIDALNPMPRKSSRRPAR